MPRNVLANFSMEELAVKYVDRLYDKDPNTKMYGMIDLRQEMINRVGPDEYDAYVEQASRIWNMING